MKQFYGNYLGIVITGGEKDPDHRGRVQIFVPNIMPALYEEWNKDGKDINFEVIGEGLSESLNPVIVERLKNILPWAECAVPITGASPSYKGSVGGFVSEVTRNVGRVVDSAIQATKDVINGLTQVKQGDQAVAQALTRGAASAERTAAGYCGAGVKNILTDAYGFPKDIPGANGQDWGKNFEKLGFTKVKINSPSEAPPGSFLTYDSDDRRGQPRTLSKRTGRPTGGSQYGHVEFVGQGSDGKPKYYFGNDGANNPGGSVPHNFTGYAYIPPPEAQLRALAKAGMPNVSPSALPHPVPTTGMEPDPTLEEESAVQLDMQMTAQDATLDKEIVSGGDNGSVIADTIFNSEARIGSSGELKVYNLPKNDGGGVFEVAGINERYHPEAANKLKGLIESGRQEEAKGFAKSYIMSYTNNVTKMSSNAGVEYALRDAAFNRGQGGANWMAKKAAGLSPSLKMDDNDRATILQAQQADPEGYLKRLYDASVEYERDKVGLRANLNDGLQKRFKDRLNNSLSLLNGGTPVTDSSVYDSQPVVKTPTQHQGISGPNTNNQALGMFGYASEGQAVWVFFREGNPLFPVYFGASFGTKEWGGIYQNASDSTGSGTPGTEKMAFNLYGGGFTSLATTEESPMGEGFAFQLYDKNGSNLTFAKDHTEFNSIYNHTQRVVGDSHDITEANKEVRVRGNYNTYAEQDVVITVGNWSQEAMDASDEIQKILNEAMEIKAKAGES